MWNFVEFIGFDKSEVIAFKDELIKPKKLKEIFDSLKPGFDETLKNGLYNDKNKISLVEFRPPAPGQSSKMWHQSFLDGQGVYVEILKLNSPHWQKGKIRMKLVVEFIPDEPEEVQAESPLDDIRQAQLSKPED